MTNGKTFQQLPNVQVQCPGVSSIVLVFTFVIINILLI